MTDVKQQKLAMAIYAGDILDVSVGGFRPVVATKVNIKGSSKDGNLVVRVECRASEHTLKGLEAMVEDGVHNVLELDGFDEVIVLGNIQDNESI